MRALLAVGMLVVGVLVVAAPVAAAPDPPECHLQAIDGACDTYDHLVYCLK